MRFGTMFAAVVFTVLSVGWGRHFTAGGAISPRIAWMLWAGLAISVAIALVRGSSWARWQGVAAGALLASVGARQVLDGGEVLDHVALLASAAASVLLLVPATGAACGVDAGASARARPGGRAHAWLCAGLLATLAILVMPGLAGTRESAPAPAPSRGGGFAETARATRSADPGRMAMTAAAGSIPWTSFGSGSKRSKSEGKPMLVDFYADWCGVCRRLDRVTFQDPEVIRRLSDLVPVRVDSEEEARRDGFRGIDLAERHAVRGYPTLVLFDAEGREISRRAGFLDPRSFLSWLDGAMRGSGLES
jgi:thiol:disulfide interchange protein